MDITIDCVDDVHCDDNDCTSDKILLVCFTCSDKPVFLCNNHDQEYHSSKFTKLHKKMNYEDYNRYKVALFSNFYSSDKDDNILLSENNFGNGLKIMLENTNNKDLQIVSFCGIIGGGNSWLIRALSPQMKVLPALKEPGTLYLTTKTLNIYYDESISRLYLDSPGFGSAFISKLQCQKYLSYSYSNSDVLCFPFYGNLCMIDYYLTDLKSLQFKKHLRTKNNKPHLIIISNFMNLNDYDNDYDYSDDINFLPFKITTSELNNRISPETKNIISNIFEQIWFVKLNSLNVDPAVVIKQYQHLSRFINSLKY